jgi:hypothetical protein
MTKNEIVKLLIKLDSEYLYQDIGYGGFISPTVFMIQGKRIPVSRITLEELRQMLSSYGY